MTAPVAVGGWLPEGAGRGTALAGTRAPAPAPAPVPTAAAVAAAGTGFFACLLLDLRAAWSTRNGSFMPPNQTSRIVTAPRNNTTSNPLKSSISTRYRFGSYRVISRSPLKMEMVISGSFMPLFLFFAGLPLVVSGIIAVFPNSKHTRSFDNLLSRRHPKRNLGVTSARDGSICVRSSVELDGWRNVCCGISKSHAAALFHVLGLYRTTISWSGLYRCTVNFDGRIGSGGGVTPPF